MNDDSDDDEMAGFFADRMAPEPTIAEKKKADKLNAGAGSLVMSGAGGSSSSTAPKPKASVSHKPHVPGLDHDDRSNALSYAKPGGGCL